MGHVDKFRVAKIFVQVLPELPPWVVLGFAAVWNLAVREILLENPVGIVAQVVQAQFLVRFGQDIERFLDDG